MYPQFLCLFRLPFERERLHAMCEAIERMWNLNMSDRDRGYLKLARVVLSAERAW